MTALAGWVLGYAVHALWQVPLVFGAAWVMARLARRAGAGVVHGVWVGALLAEAVLPGCPMVFGDWVQTAWAGLLHGGVGGGQVRVGFGAGMAGVSVGWRLPWWLPVGACAVYGCAVVYFAGRLGWGLWRTRGMRLRAEGLTGEGAERVARVPHVSESRHGAPGFLVGAHVFGARHGAPGVRDFAVRVSSEVAGPVTVGLWRGVVLLPVGFAEAVTEEDLRAVLAHEAAHVLRRDFLKNAVFGFVTVLVAFHPVAWGTRARVAESREMVCDALAAEAGAGRERYAGSLLRLAAMRIAPERMLHAIGILERLGAYSFERRVMNLTGKYVEMKGVRRVAVVAACVVLGLGTGMSALGLARELRVEVPVGKEAAKPQRAPGMVRVSGAVMAGNVLTRVNPVYPPDAKEAGITGAVVMSAVIGKDGVIENLQVISGPEKLRMSALDSVRQWTYKPYLLNGVVVVVQTVITVNYTLAL